MSYILEVNEHVRLTPLQDALEQIASPSTKEVIMTAGQLLRLEGAHQRECELMLRQLKKRFGDEVTQDTEARLAAASTEQINTWADRILTAHTLSETLAD